MASAERPHVLLTGPVSISGGDVHPYAAGRLRAGLDAVDWVEVADHSQIVTRDLVSLRVDPELPEGGYRIDVSATPDGGAIAVAGGPFSGVIQGVEALIRHARIDAGAVTLPTGGIERLPALAYRTFWTWDHSTHWDVDSFGMQETGAFNPYGKQPEAFVSDYRRMIDFMSRHGIGGVVIYGLLRDSHGGVDAANEIGRYGRERGVRVLAGVAVNSYGGIYYEGQHRYNLATWLRQHPQLAADTASLPGFQIGDYGYLGFPHGDYTMAALSEHPEMEPWHRDAIAWLLDTITVDGINIEFGDYAGNDAMADMRRLLPGLIDTARRRQDDLWLMTELGEWDFIAEAEAPRKVSGLPDGSIYQFTYNRSYWQTVRSRLAKASIDRLPTAVNSIRPHAGSQWNRQRYAFMAPHYAELAGVAQRTGLDGVTIFGEVSDYSPPNELNYVAFARFSIEADLTWERFVSEEVEPRLGGAEPAGRFVSFVERLDTDALQASDLPAARDEVRATAASLPDPERRRWAWLEERLSRRIHARLGR